MKIRHILSCITALALAGLTVWHLAGINTPVTVTTSTSPSQTISNDRKVTSENGSMMVTGRISGVEIDSGVTPSTAPEDNPRWQAAHKDAQKQREKLAEK